MTGLLSSGSEVDPLCHRPARLECGVSSDVQSRGRPKFRIPTRWGKSERISLIGTDSLHGAEEAVEVGELEGTCTGEQGVAYLNMLALEGDPAHTTVAILDHAPFHQGQRCERSRRRSRACFSGICRRMHRF